MQKNVCKTWIKKANSWILATLITGGKMRPNRISPFGRGPCWVNTQIAVS